MTSVAQLLREGRDRLAESSPSPRLDARILLAHVLGCTDTWLHTWPEHEPAEEQTGHYRALLARRAHGQPVAYLTGAREFFGHCLRVSGATLIPRPETELLVEVLFERLPADQPLSVADVGTGTGAVALALALARPGWSVLASDQEQAALELARENARRLGAENVRLLRSDWCAALPEGLDGLVANPPYVSEGDPHLDRGDARFEPRVALCGGVDGLDAVRVIVRQAPGHLRAGGLLALEHGWDQGQAVRALLDEAGLGAIETLRDLAGHERVTVARNGAKRGKS